MSDSDCPFVYCQACNERIDVPVVHKDATNNHYQLVSVPVDLELSVKLDNYKAYCNNCGNTNIIDRWSFSSDGHAVDVGDLTVACRYNAGQQT